jgi:hypothetical protein
MVRSARFSWNDEDGFELPDRSSGLDDLDDFDFDGFEIARKRVERSRERRDESPEPELNSQP